MKVRILTENVSTVSNNVENLVIYLNGSHYRICVEHNQLAIRKTSFKNNERLIIQPEVSNKITIK